MPQCRPLALVGFYPFDGDTNDYSGNGNHLAPAMMHGITFVGGVEGQAAHFEPKSGSFIDLPIDAGPTAMPKLTGAWVRPRTIGPIPMEILSTDKIDYGRTLTIDNRSGLECPDRARFDSRHFSAEPVWIGAYSPRLPACRSPTRGPLWRPSMTMPCIA